MTWWFPRQNSRRRKRADSHLTRRLIFAPCSCYRRSLPRTSQVAQVRPRVSTITKGGLRSHLTCQENFRAQSRSRTSPTLPKRWEREPSSAVWKGSYRKNLPKEVPKRLPHKNKNHQTLRKKRNKVPKTKSSGDCKNRSESSVVSHTTDSTKMCAQDFTKLRRRLTQVLMHKNSIKAER